MLICRYRDIFALEKGVAGKTNLATHKIKTGDGQPVLQRPRKLPWAKREEASWRVSTQKFSLAV